MHWGKIALLFVVGFCLTVAHGAPLDPAKRYTSDFEILMDRIDPVKGEFPFPPTEIVKRLEGPEKYVVNSAIFPHGRSPEARFTDYVQPRTIISWKADYDRNSDHVSGLIGPWRDLGGPPIFIGYTPRENQLEIISFNLESGETEFRKVKNYGPGMKQSIERKSKVACQACHQSGAAIFSPPEWLETPQSKVVFHKLEKLLKEPFAKSILSSYGKPLSFGPDSYKFESHSDAPRVNVDTDAFNTLIFARQACPVACGEDLECKRGLVAEALLFRHKESRKYLNDARIEMMRDIFDQQLQDLASPVLENSNPRKDGTFNLKGDNVSPLLSRFQTQPVSFFNWDGRVCFNLTLKEREHLLQLPFEQIETALNSSAMTEFLKSNWVMNSEGLMAIVANPAAPKGLVLRPPATSPAPPKPEYIKEPVKLFAKYCANCHSGGRDIAPDLPLKNLKKLARYNGRFADTTEELVEFETMPPAKALQPTPEERERMVKALKAAK